MCIVRLLRHALHLGSRFPKVSRDALALTCVLNCMALSGNTTEMAEHECMVQARSIAVALKGPLQSGRWMKREVA